MNKQDFPGRTEALELWRETVKKLEAAFDVRQEKEAAFVGGLKRLAPLEIAYEKAVLEERGLQLRLQAIRQVAEGRQTRQKAEVKNG